MLCEKINGGYFPLDKRLTFFQSTRDWRDIDLFELSLNLDRKRIFLCVFYLDLSIVRIARLHRFHLNMFPK